MSLASIRSQSIQQHEECARTNLGPILRAVDRMTPVIGMIVFKNTYDAKLIVRGIRKVKNMHLLLVHPVYQCAIALREGIAWCPRFD